MKQSLFIIASKSQQRKCWTNRFKKKLYNYYLTMFEIYILPSDSQTIPSEIQSTKDAEKDSRKAKFVLYYMTTTLYSTSTSTSTSSSYTGTNYSLHHIINSFLRIKKCTVIWLKPVLCKGKW